MLQQSQDIVISMAKVGDFKICHRDCSMHSDISMAPNFQLAPSPLIFSQKLDVDAAECLVVNNSCL